VAAPPPPREAAAAVVAAAPEDKGGGVSGVAAPGNGDGVGVSRPLLLPSDSSSVSSLTDPGVCTNAEGTGGVLGVIGEGCFPSIIWFASSYRAELSSSLFAMRLPSSNDTRGIGGRGRRNFLRLRLRLYSASCFLYSAEYGERRGELINLLLCALNLVFDGADGELKLLSLIMQVGPYSSEEVLVKVEGLLEFLERHLVKLPPVPPFLVRFSRD